MNHDQTCALRIQRHCLKTRRRQSLVRGWIPRRARGQENKVMIFRLRLAIIALGSFLAFVGTIHADACCAWTDKKACAACPSNYIAGCRTQGNQCSCSCSNGTGDLVGKLSANDAWLHQQVSKAVDVMDLPAKFTAKSSSILLRDDLAFTIEAPYVLASDTLCLPVTDDSELSCMARELQSPRVFRLGLRLSIR